MQGYDFPTYITENESTDIYISSVLGRNIIFGTGTGNRVLVMEPGPGPAFSQYLSFPFRFCSAYRFELVSDVTISRA